MIWRYDPILLSARYDLQYHAAVFEELAAQLAGSTKKCIISFLDYYPKIKAGLHQAGLRGLSEDEQRRPCGCIVPNSPAIWSAAGNLCGSYRIS